MQAHVVTQVQGVITIVFGGQMNHHQKYGRLLLNRHPLPAYILGQTCLSLGNPVLHLDSGIIRVCAGFEGNGHLQYTVRTRHRLHVHHVFHAVNSFLQRRRDCFRNHLGIGARIDSAHHHGRWHDFRILTDWQGGNRNEPSDKYHDRHDSRKNRPIDEKF